MKLLKKYLEKDCSGTIRLLPQEPEDMWHLFNLIHISDKVRSTTIRRIQTESSTGSTDSHRQRLTLTVTVKDIFFDTQVCSLRLNGMVCEENKFVKLNAFHTLDLELHSEVSITKQCWDRITLKRVDDACDISKTADVGAVVCMEGLAHVCLVTQYMTVTRQKIEVVIPRKRMGSSAQRDKAMERFYRQVYDAIVKHFDFGVVKAVILASPGFVKENLKEFVLKEAVKVGERSVLENKGKFILAHCSSGYKHALTEVLDDPTVKKQLSDTKAMEEVRALEAFYDVLSKDPERAYYGYEHVKRAANQGALKVLMLTDRLFRAQDVQIRKQYIQLVNIAEKQGSRVYLFSSMHTSGEQLNQLTGVAAILSFAIAEEE